MKNLIKTLYITLLLILTNGCINTTLHLYHCSVTTVYEPTCIVWNDCICCWSHEKYMKHPMTTTLVRYTYPFWLVDFPCEIVFDTLTFPYDLYKKYDHPHNRSMESEKTFDKFISEDIKKQ